jgi:hypothetical protein
MRARRWSRVLLGLVWVAAGARAAESAAARALGQFTEEYCLKCHDAITQKGDRDFENFTLPLKSVADLIAAKDIVDQLTLGEMPPVKEKRPSDDQRLAVIRLLRESIATARGKIETPWRTR